MGYLHTLPLVKTHTAAVAYSGLTIAALYMLSFFRAVVPLAAAISQLLYITSATRKAQILTPALYALSACLLSAACCSLAVSRFLFIHAFIFSNTYFTLSSSMPHNNTDSSFIIPVTQRLGVFFPVSSCSAISA